jgi:hypothetical protein
MLNDVMGIICRHVAPHDDAFTARMRFHQSWYRAAVLNLPQDQIRALVTSCTATC